MKKRIIFLLMFILVIAGSSFARPIEVPRDALATFTKEFVSASEVNWEKGSNYYKASFQMKGEYLQAFFTQDGEIIAVSRNILSTTLPIRLQTVLAKDYPTFWITDLFEYAASSQTKYYVTLENASQKTTLESIDTIDWSIFKNVTKK